MDSIRVSEAPDPGSIPGEATKAQQSTGLKEQKPTSNSILVWGFSHKTKIEQPLAVQVIQGW